MPPKRSKSKISFKIFSTKNYLKFANKFPFLEKRQIKAKLLQAWRNLFTSEHASETTKTKDELKITKQRNEAPCNEGKIDFVIFYVFNLMSPWYMLVSIGKRQLLLYNCRNGWIGCIKRACNCYPGMCINS